MSDSLGSNEKPGSLPTSQGILKPPRLVLDNQETASQASGAMHNGEPENKKAHLDDDKDDDKTSTYERTITTKSVSQSFSPNVLTALAITLPPTQAAPRTRPLRNCVDMNLSMEDSRDAMKPHQILTSFIRRKDSSIRGHRNHNGRENHRETHQGNQQEYSEEHNQEDLSQSTLLMRRSFKYPRDNRQKKRHVSPSDPTCSIEKQHQLMAPTLLHQ
ncbi:hypothetical protein HPB50_014252 [Hyalomma asiaticum]|uniref:Uncharacterized protein n=1 Tax=Hyalomma asiaticum TaxID=266040 RepID=A0ACB7TI71_HYAAI|nr:hypothetical protein HPB50_014252 [Hyalomma asiaticum]